MQTISKISAAATVALGLLLSTGAFASAPAFTVAPANSGMAITDFASQLSAYNKQDVTDLVDAKKVTVIHYSEAWTGPDVNTHDRVVATDASAALNLLVDDAQSIHLLREGLKADPAAVKLLAEHKIPVDQVIDITADGQGNVSIYVS